jgi:hypothetical protein
MVSTLRRSWRRHKQLRRAGPSVICEPLAELLRSRPS